MIKFKTCRDITTGKFEDIEIPYEQIHGYMNIKDLSKDHLFEIANIATGGHFKSDFSKDQKEVETGGYGYRKRVEWVGQDRELHFFEIDGEAKDRGWHWYSGVFTYDGDGKFVLKAVRCVNTPAVVDYCDENGIDVRNKII